MLTTPDNPSMSSVNGTSQVDGMHPDPAPLPPPSLEDIRAQIQRLEAAHRSKGVQLSGRIIHVCHHLPVEIIKVVPQDALDGMLLPPMTPEFKGEDAEPTVESHDSKWKIHGRTAHPSLVSGIKSLSDSHEQLVVAWTGEILLQTQSQPTPRPTPQALPLSIAQVVDNGERPSIPSQPTMVHATELTPDEKREINTEIKRFAEVDNSQGATRVSYHPVFLPPDVSKGHYEGFCKKSELYQYTEP